MSALTTTNAAMDAKMAEINAMLRMMGLTGSKVLFDEAAALKLKITELGVAAYVAGDEQGRRIAKAEFDLDFDAAYHNGYQAGHRVGYREGYTTAAAEALVASDKVLRDATLDGGVDWS